MNEFPLNGAELNGAGGPVIPATLGYYGKTVRLSNGVAAEGAVVVVTTPEGQVVDLWSGPRDGAESPAILGQQVLTDAAGSFAFYVPFGRYDISITYGGETVVKPDQLIGPDYQSQQAGLDKKEPQLAPGSIIYAPEESAPLGYVKGRQDVDLSSYPSLQAAGIDFELLPLPDRPVELDTGLSYKGALLNRRQRIALFVRESSDASSGGAGWFNGFNLVYYPDGYKPGRVNFNLSYDSNYVGEFALTNTNILIAARNQAPYFDFLRVMNSNFDPDSGGTFMFDQQVTPTGPGADDVEQVTANRRMKLVQRGDVIAHLVASKESDDDSLFELRRMTSTDDENLVIGENIRDFQFNFDPIHASIGVTDSGVAVGVHCNSNLNDRFSLYAIYPDNSTLGADLKDETDHLFNSGASIDARGRYIAALQLDDSYLKLVIIAVSFDGAQYANVIEQNGNTASYQVVATARIADSTLGSLGSYHGDSGEIDDGAIISPDGQWVDVTRYSDTGFALRQVLRYRFDGKNLMFHKDIAPADWEGNFEYIEIGDNAYAPILLDPENETFKTVAEPPVGPGLTRLPGPSEIVTNGTTLVPYIKL